jgi:hypothetical protein
MSIRPVSKLQRIGHISWLIFIVLSISLFIAGIPVYYQELSQICVDETCVSGQLTRDTETALRDLGISIRHRAVFILTIITVNFFVMLTLAVLIFWKRSNDWFALFLSLTFVSFMVDSTTVALLPLLPGWLTPIIYFATVGGITFPIIFYLFPDGRPVPRWTRFLILGWIGLIISIFFLYIPMPVLSEQIMEEIIPFLWMAIFIGSILTQIYRYQKDSTPLQRHQTKWIVYALFVILSFVIPWVLWGEYAKASGDAYKILISDLLDYLVGTFITILIALSFGIAVLRYKLWDIDLVIRRTLIYSALTGTLALIYYISVALLQRLFTAGSPISIVFSTLAVAALFSPLRRRIQDAIDKRFYRYRYDVEQTIASFAISIRDEVDSDRIAKTLISTVDKTIQPEHVSLWLRTE